MGCLKHDKHQLKKKCTCGLAREYTKRGAATAVCALDDDKDDAATSGTPQHDFTVPMHSHGQSTIARALDGTLRFAKRARTEPQLPPPPCFLGASPPPPPPPPLALAQMLAPAPVPVQPQSPWLSPDFRFSPPSLVQLQLQPQRAQPPPPPRQRPLSLASGAPVAVVLNTCVLSALETAKAKKLAAKKKKNTSAVVPPDAVSAMYDFPCPCARVYTEKTQLWSRPRTHTRKYCLRGIAIALQKSKKSQTVKGRKI